MESSVAPMNRLRDDPLRALLRGPLVRISLVIFVGLVAADIATKVVVHVFLGIGSYHWVVRPTAFVEHLQHAGDLDLWTYLRVALALPVLIVMACIFQFGTSTRLKAAVAYIAACGIAGVFANNVERMQHGSVTDFMGLSVAGHVFVGNVADICRFGALAAAVVVAVLYVVRPHPNLVSK